MFKFMKSKKGFTLVELMIVVVIMAILVAVAVPIFSAVTKNARTKTCVSNMREIVSQITNKAMSEGKNYEGTISYKADEDGKVAVDDITDDGSDITAEQFVAMFQAGAPACPAEGTYNIEFGTTGAGDADGSVSVKVTCSGNTDGGDHVYGEAAEEETTAA